MGTKMAELIIKDLHVKVNNKEILKGVNLEINKNEIVALMGMNGSGKSTLAHTLMGHPNYEITKGQVIFKGKNITNAKPNERSKLGLFLSFQHPQEVSGVTYSNFLRTALNSSKGKTISIIDFNKILKEKMQLLSMDEKYAYRYLNEGFSGGERKKAEILQLAVLEPDLAILDETDSGLDVTALKTVGEGVNKVKSKTNMAILLITHYERMLNYIKPDRVYVISNGKIIKEGGQELAYEIDKRGYDHIKE